MPGFVIGTGRSGSSLLGAMLNQHTELAVPHASPILSRMTPLLGRYGDLSDPDHFSMLVDDVCRLVESAPVPWQGVILDRAAIEASCRERSLVAIVGAVYACAAQAKGARSWCSTQCTDVHHLASLEAYFPDARYVHLYRDGRDVALSFRGAPIGEKHVYHLAREWREAQRIAMQLRECVDPRRFFSLSYEELIEDSEWVLRRLSAFLGVLYEPAMLDYHRSDEARRLAAGGVWWHRIAAPVIAGNRGKFRTEMSDGHLRIYESVAGDTLDALGYVRAAVRPGDEMQFTAADIQAFEIENLALKERVRARATPDEIERRAHQSRLLQQIRARPVLTADFTWVNL